MLALKSFKDLITFSTWNGLITARQKAGPLGPARTKAKRHVTNLMRECNLALEALSQTDRDLWARAAAGSTYTWKDLYTSRYFTLAHTHGQPPMVASSLSATLAGSDITISSSLGHYVILDETGWGSIAYGSHPFGAPAKYNVPGGAALAINYRLITSHPIAEPRPNPAKCTPARGLCKVPIPPEEESEAPNPTVPAGWLYTVDIKEDIKWYSIDPLAIPDCATLHTQTMMVLKAFPQISDNNDPALRLQFYRRLIGGVLSEDARAKRVTLLARPHPTLTEAVWKYVTNVFFGMAWSRNLDMTGWKISIDFLGETRTPTYGDINENYTPPPYDYFWPKVGFHNETEGASNCPTTPYAAFTELTGWHYTQFDHDEFPIQTGGTISAPALSAYDAGLSGQSGNPPVLCPPVEVN